MQYNIDYSRKYLFNELNPLINDLNLNQLVDFTTWSRSINNILRVLLSDNNTVVCTNCDKVKLLPMAGCDTLQNAACVSILKY